jgi:hypothetical protein
MRDAMIHLAIFPYSVANTPGTPAKETKGINQKN